MTMPAKIHIINADFALPSDSGLYGHLERINAFAISGWLVDLNSGKGTLTAFAGGQSVASGTLDIWRQDIADLSGQARAYGFNLYWQPWNLNAFQFGDAESYPLVFVFNGVAFGFANYPLVSRQELELAKNALPKTAAGKYGEMGDTQANCLENTEEKVASLEGDARLVAFYSPQFYPRAPEDALPADAPGDWSAVVMAKPLFDGHRQPQIPEHGNFYDLRLGQARCEQAALAAKYGIYGFCYYYFHAGARVLVNQPLEGMLKSGQPDFPFCLCLSDALCARSPTDGKPAPSPGPEYDPESAEEIIKQLLPFLLDDRYIRPDGRPILLVDNPASLADPAATAEQWRQVCHKYGIEKLHLCALTSDAGLNPHEIGFDSITLFPVSKSLQAANSIAGLPDSYEGRVYAYEDIVKNELGRRQPAYKMFPCVLTGWDDSPLNPGSARICHAASAGLYEVWLRAAIDRAGAHLPANERFVFIAAWNDWVHGAHLEPDTDQGHKYLDATKRAVSRKTDWRKLLAYGLSVKNIGDAEKDALLNELGARLNQLQLQVESYDKLYGISPLRKDLSRVKAGRPVLAAGMTLSPGGQVCFDDVSGVKNPALVCLDASQVLYCKGWAFTQGESLKVNTPTWLLLLSEDDGSIAYNGLICQRQEREDVAMLYADMDADTIRFSGFQQLFDISCVKNGVWRLGLLTVHGAEARIAQSNVRIEVEE